MNINRNPNFGTHNTTRRTGEIKYIVIHYVGATGDASDNIEYYNRPTTVEASADFYVGHGGDVWQYNPDPRKRYCWAVGGKRQSRFGGSLHGVVRNSNSISIEMCVKSRGVKVANHRDWYFTKETVGAAVELTKHLMKEYGIPAERVVRHFDVTGKLCPGVIGWNYPSGSEEAWADFKKRIGGNYVPVQTKEQAVQSTKEAPAGDCEQEVQSVNVELPVLKRGDKGEAVRSWQQLLVAKGYDPEGVDGSFGPGCEAATREYQRDRKLTVDGKVGPQVYGAIWPLK